VSIKKILAAVEHLSSPNAVLRTGMSLASRFDAVLTCVYVITPVDGPRYAGGTTLDAVMGEIARRHDTCAAKVREAFESATRRLGIRTEWRLARGFPDGEAIVNVRYCDLAIVAQSDPAPERSSFPLHADAVVLAAGCPVVVVPRQGYFSTSARRILVAWNASTEATRAVNGALLFLQEADAVEVVVVNPGKGHEGLGGHGAEPGADIAAHLSRHGVRLEVHLERTDGESVGARLLSRAEQLGAELIVAGAYGRSRAREFVLGGVTQHLLHHAPIPVLFSH
jgi:nucleotide-binding universal stress UspA family protein